MSDQLTVTPVVLEPAAQAFADATADPPYLFELGLVEGRTTFEEVQNGEIDKPNVDIEDTTAPGGPSGEVSVRIMRPRGATGPLPVVIYIHGAGWVVGNSHTHDRLIRELSVGANAAVVFPSFSLSPEARYPTAIEESYAVLRWAADHGADQGLDASRIAIAGDSVGGNMTAALSLIAKERSARAWSRSCCSTRSRTRASTPTRTASSPPATSCAATRCGGSGISTRPRRRSATRSRRRRSCEDRAARRAAAGAGHHGRGGRAARRGRGLRRKLRAAGVDVTATRYEGVIHDFVMLNALRETNGAVRRSLRRPGFLRARLGA